MTFTVDSVRLLMVDSYRITVLEAKLNWLPKRCCNFRVHRPCRWRDLQEVYNLADPTVTDSTRKLT